MTVLDQALRAIAEPRRRQILLLTKDIELSSGEIASHFDITPPAVSQHLKMLAEVGLVSVRKEGPRRLYRTKPEGLEGLRRFLSEFWDSRLQVLKELAEAQEMGVESDF